MLRPRRRRRRTPAQRARSSAAHEAADAADLGDDRDVLLGVRDLGVTVTGPDGGELTLVEQLSFTLRAGRTLAIVGESGCGKSVTARALLGVPPAGGRIGGSVRFDGTELVGARASVLRSVRGRRIGFVGQDPMAALDPTQTVGGGLVELIRAYSGCGRAAARTRALAVLQRVQLRDPQRVSGLYPHQMSGGMAQRVMIARALCGDPEVLIADEPTTALDVTVQAEILALLRTLQDADRIAVLLITHDWGVVAGLADDVLVMYAGQSVESAAAETVFARPRHPYTDGLLRCDPHRGAAGAELPVIPGTVPSPAEWPHGCRFADRCPLSTEECRAHTIPVVGVEPAHDSRCIHVEQLVGAR